MDVNELVSIKKKIEAAKVEKSRAEGALEELETRLKTEFKLNSFEDAEAHLEHLDNEITALEKDIQKGMADLRDRYDL